jgi:hypothetical protein
LLWKILGSHYECMEQPMQTMMITLLEAHDHDYSLVSTSVSPILRVKTMRRRTAMQILVVSSNYSVVRGHYPTKEVLRYLSFLNARNCEKGLFSI